MGPRGAPSLFQSPHLCVSLHRERSGPDGSFGDPVPSGIVFSCHSDTGEHTGCHQGMSSEDLKTLVVSGKGGERGPRKCICLWGPCPVPLLLLEKPAIIALARWLGWLGHRPVHQKVAGSIPGFRTLRCGFDPWSGRVQEATDRCFCLSVSHIHKHFLR